MHFRLLLFVLLVPTLVQAQTVTKVIDGVTLGLDSGDVVKLKGIKLSNDKATRERARRLLISFVLDRPITLEESEDIGWKIEAVVKWRGVDIGKQLVNKGVVVKEGRQQPQQTPAPQAPVSSPPQQAPRVYRYYYPPARSYVPYYYNQTSNYTPQSAYCVGNT